MKSFKKLKSYCHKLTLYLTACILMMPCVVNASFMDLKIVTGTKALFADVTKGLLYIVGSLLILVCLINGLKYIDAEAEEKSMYVKAVKGKVVAGVLCVCVAPFIEFVLKFFQ